MPHTILVLDDDPQARDSLVLYLEDQGYEILQARSAEEALDLLRTQHAELAVVDLRLPGMDGPEFIPLAEKQLPGLRFIIYTGSPEYLIPVELTQKSSVSDTIFLKPLPDFESLNAEIHHMLDN